MIFFFLIICLSDSVLIFEEEITCWSIIWIFLCVCLPHLFMYLLFSLVRFFLQHQTANFLPPSLDSRLISVWSFSPSTSICSPTERSLLDFHYWSPGCCQECCNFLVLSFDCFSQSIITPFLTWSIIVMKSLRTYTITYTEEFFCLAWQRYKCTSGSLLHTCDVLSQGHFSLSFYKSSCGTVLSQSQCVYCIRLI